MNAVRSENDFENSESHRSYKNQKYEYVLKVDDEVIFSENKKIRRTKFISLRRENKENTSSLEAFWSH